MPAEAICPKNKATNNTTASGNTEIKISKLKISFVPKLTKNTGPIQIKVTLSIVFLACL